MAAGRTVGPPAEAAIANVVRGVIDPELWLAQQLGVDLLGSIPLDPAVSLGGDIGEPAALGDPKAPAAQAFARLADRIITETIPPVELAVCSIRQLLTEAGADLESAFERIQQSHEPVTATAPANDYHQSRSNP